MIDYKSVVDAGVQWLDANRPGWRDRIDRDSLNMENERHCIAGQSGGYFEAMSEAGYHPFTVAGEYWAQDHGFMLSDSVPLSEYDVEHDALAAEWLTRL